MNQNTSYPEVKKAQEIVNFFIDLLKGTDKDVGIAKLDPDGVWGPLTMAALNAVKSSLNKDDDQSQLSTNFDYSLDSLKEFFDYYQKNMTVWSDLEKHLRPEMYGVTTVEKTVNDLLQIPELKSIITYFQNYFANIIKDPRLTGYGVSVSLESATGRVKIHVMLNDSSKKQYDASDYYNNLFKEYLDDLNKFLDKGNIILPPSFKVLDLPASSTTVAQNTK